METRQEKIHVNAKSRKIEILESALKRILNKHYQGIYDFFYDITQSEENFKFLVARRCLVLYQIFLPIFKNNIDNFEVKGKVYSDKAIEKYRNYLAENLILLADDILIHGRHINELYTELKRYVSPEKINVKVYMLSKEPKCLEKKLEEKILSSQVGAGWEWKTLSNCIVEAICASSVPYTSFVCSYEGAEQIRSFLEKCDAKGIESKTDEECQWSIVFPKVEEQSLFEVLSHFNCVRTYYNSKLESYTVIPYVITKAVDAKNIRAFFVEFASHFETFPAITEDFEFEGDCLWNLYRMRLFNAVLSHLYGIYIFKDLYNSQIIEIDTIEKSFGEKIANEFQRMDYESVKSIVQADYSNLECFISIASDRIPIKSEKEYKSLIYKQHCKDEKLAELGLAKEKGNSFDQLFSINQTIEQKKEIAKIVIGLMDIGFVSAVYALNDEDEYYASFISAGEQSYKYILETYAAVVRMMLFLEMKHENVIKYLKYIAEELKWSEESLKALEEFYNQTKGKLFDWNIEAILRNPERRESGEEILKANEKYIDNIL